MPAFSLPRESHSEPPESIAAFSVIDSSSSSISFSLALLYGCLTNPLRHAAGTASVQCQLGAVPDSAEADVAVRERTIHR